ncbi:MAG: GSCFA domain-containing protein [Cyclobacteriaceae bacterium]|nr:GSCFA domain-containing protein [Cyclobacteriaceae bacterium]
MNTFRTEINCSPSSPIGLDHKIFTIGSCFADQFGQWLINNKFTVLANPFGTAYNPISIHNLLLDALHNYVDSNLFTEHNGLWFHHNWHSQFTVNSQAELLAELQRVQKQIRTFLQEVDVVIITYGTAWVYELLATNQLVNNCHKVPATHFRKRLLSAAEIETSFRSLIQTLKSIRPNLRVICTVSPVRHLKDTFELNQVSKSALRLACYQIEQEKLAAYFPAYEIMMDDLRDYRFYERDMIHPSAEAREYINQKFSDRYFTPDTLRLLQTLKEIQKALAHKPFQLTSVAHQNFLKDTLRKLESIQHQLPVTSEIESVRAQLIHHA